MPSPVALLAERVRRDPARPLLTQYADGARTELSALSFANWVDKTVHWLVTEDLSDLDGDPDSGRLAIELAVTEPAHWMTFVWTMAAWQAGLAMTPGPDAEAVLRVGGPGTVAADSELVISCSLHPFAMPGPVGPGVLDFSDEVRPQPDSHDAAPADPDRVAWIDPQRTLTVGELLTGLEPAATVVEVVPPVDPWTAIRHGLLGPLLGGGSAVLISGRVDPEELSRIRRSEGITTG